jgi:hypothetical protein
MEIVVDGALVTAATVILAFILNQGAAWAGLTLSELAKKLVVFVTAVGLTGYSAYQGGISLPSGDPMELGVALLAAGTAVFKVAQPVYDQIWKKLIAA